LPQDLSVVVKRFDHNVGYGGLAEIKGTHAGLVEQTIQGRKDLPGAEDTPCEGPMGRQTAVEPPGEEDRAVRDHI
jgi:hypothetical protein